MSTPIESIMQPRAAGLSVGHTDVPTEIVVIAQGLAKTPDVSSYAKGRLRCWLPVEPPLGPTRPWLHGHQSPDAAALFDWATSVIHEHGHREFMPDVMLVTDAGPTAVGITPHRDASYASYEAWGINLQGDGVFSYTEGYPEYRWSRTPVRNPRTVQLSLTTGSVVRFNCKNLHAATSSVGRLSLQIWRVSPKMRDEFLRFRRLSS